MSLNTILATTPLTSTNYVLKATGTTIGNSLIWDNGTNVGIGNTNTSYTLDVSGTGRFTGNTTVNGLAIAATPSANKLIAYGSTNIGLPQSSGSTFTTGIARLYDSTNVTIDFGTNGGVSPYPAWIQARDITNMATNYPLLLNPNGGNVGIGTSSPYAIASGKNVTIEDSTGSDIALTFGLNGTRTGQIYTSTAQFRLSSVTNIPMLFFTNDTERMRITSGGDVLVGWTGGTFNDPAYNGQQGISFRGTSTGTSIISSSTSTSMYVNRFGGGAIFASVYSPSVGTAGTTVGTISVSSSSTSYNTTSDYRLKEDLKETKGLEKISAINVYNFKWKNSDERMDGVIAHELQEILPYAVLGEKDGQDMQGVDYSKLTPILVKAIQEQQIQIQNLQEQINILAK